MTHQEMLFVHIINVIKQMTDKFEDKITVQRYDESQKDVLGIIFLPAKSDNYDLDGLVSESKKFEIRVTCEDNQEDIFENWEFIEKFVDKFIETDSTVEGLGIESVSYLGSKVIPLYTNAYGLQELKCSISMTVYFDDYE